MQETELKIRLKSLHEKQLQVSREAGRFNVLCCGRRFGKDVLGENLILTHNGAIGGRVVAWFAPTYRMMLDNFRDVSNLVRPVASKVNASEHRIELVTGGIIDFWSLDAPDVARGRKYNRVVINEAAMVPGLVDVWQRIIRPTLADYQGDAWFLSTPRGYNDFHKLWQRGQDGAEGWRSWRFPTWANPYIKQAEIDAMRAELDSVSFAQEIGAEFRSIVGLVYADFNDENITSDDYDPALPFEIGFDDGYIDPRVFLLIQRTPTGVLVFDEIVHTRRLDEESIRELLERCVTMAGKTVPDDWAMSSNTARSAWCASNGVALPEIAVGSSEAVQLMRRLREANIVARGGTHQIVDGIRVVRQLILDGNGVRSLKVHRRCKTLIEEMTNGYRYPDKERRDNEKPADGNEHTCLVAGTLVTTSRGDIPIQDVQVGDFAMTRNGYAPVSVSMMTDPSARVITVEFDNGSSITGTTNHPVYVTGKGFIPLHALRYGDSIVACKQNLSNITAQNGEDTQNLRDSTTSDISSAHRISGSVDTKSISTDKSGKTLTARYRSGITSTMLMEIRSTTRWPIFNALRQASISAITATLLAMKPKRNDWSESKTFVHWLLLGMGRMMVANGTAPWARHLGFSANTSRANASIVEPNSRPGIKEIQGFAATDAKAQVDWRLASITKPDIANGAAKHSPSTNITAPNVAVCRVLRVIDGGSVAPVYNITVDNPRGKGEYFANGILVSNCDALRYWSFLRSGRR